MTKTNLIMDIKAQSRTLKALGGLLHQETDLIELDLNQSMQVMDITDICMVIAITDVAKRLLHNFIKKDNIQKEPSIDYTPKNLEISKTKLSTEYLKHIFAILQPHSESIKFTNGNNMPMTMETEHFKIILAPKVEY